MPHMHYGDPYGNHGPAILLLIAGTFFLVLATVYAYTGEAWLRGGGHYERTRDPIKFWLAVAFYYGLGAVTISIVYH